jgi:predicted transcriptional regulator
VVRSDELDLRGDLQEEVMRIVWRLGAATVDAVRAAQPKRSRSAYTTIQTVLNRLVDRGLLRRERRGRAFVYRAAYDESELLARSIGQRLAAASVDARRAVVLNLVEALEPDELEDVARLAKRISRARGSS